MPSSAFAAALRQDKKFKVGIDRSKMRLFDVAPDQQNISDANQVEDSFAEPVFDRTGFGEDMDAMKDFKV